jgi:Ser/Thr protein kinase RdoA (MazF antagonist)
VQLAESQHPAPPLQSRLAAHLRKTLGVPDLSFAETPTRLLGGNRSFVYAFRLSGVQPPFDSPLVLRVLRDPRAGNVRLEATLHEALLAQGLPVPCVLAFYEGSELLGGPFQILERLFGGPLLQGFDDSDQVSAGLLGHRLRHVCQALFAPWPEGLAAIHEHLHGLDPHAVREALEAAGFDVHAFGLEARVAELEASVSALGLDALVRGAAWLRAGLGRLPATLALCHGDLFPNQVFVKDSAVSGVLDWSDALLAPAEIDLGITKAGLETLPILAGPLTGVSRSLLRRLARRFLSGYAARRPIDPEALRFGEALRCLSGLVSIAERRLALSCKRPTGPNPYDSAAGIRALCARLSTLTALPFDASVIPGGEPS